MKTQVPLTVISCTWGGFNSLRKAAMFKALSKIDEIQYVMPSQWLFLEMTEADVPHFIKSSSELPPWITYMPIKGHYRNRNLFQKEALWNLGMKYAANDRLLFMDADFHIENSPYWFLQVHDAIAPGKAIHPVGLVKYDGNVINDDYTQLYMASMWSNKEKYKDIACKEFPGLSIAVHRDDMEDVGFGTFGISGNGDVIFWRERTSWNPKYFDPRLMAGMVRPNLPKLQPECIDVYAIHHYHGEIKDRAYIWSREIISLMALPSVLTYVDASGLLAWRDPDCWLADILMKKHEMTTKEELLDLLQRSAEERISRFSGM